MNGRTTISRRAMLKAGAGSLVGDAGDTAIGGSVGGGQDALRQFLWRRLGKLVAQGIF